MSRRYSRESFTRGYATDGRVVASTANFFSAMRFYVSLKEHSQVDTRATRSVSERNFAINSYKVIYSSKDGCRFSWSRLLFFQRLVVDSLDADTFVCGFYERRVGNIGASWPPLYKVCALPLPLGSPIRATSPRLGKPHTVSFTILFFFYLTTVERKISCRFLAQTCPLRLQRETFLNILR